MYPSWFRIWYNVSCLKWFGTRDQKLIRDKKRTSYTLYLHCWKIKSKYIIWCLKCLRKLTMEYVRDRIGLVSSIVKLKMWHILLLCLRTKISDYHITEYEILAHPNLMQKCIYHFNITSQHARNLWYSSVTVMKTCCLAMKHMSSYRTHIVLLANDS